MPKNDDVKIATELYEKLPEHEKKTRRRTDKCDSGTAACHIDGIRR